MFVYIIFSAIFQTILAYDLPSNFPRCHVDDPELNKCLLNATEIVRPYLRKGVPELRIPALDPLFIPELVIQQGTDSMNYKVTVTNVSIYGFDKYVFTEFGFNPKTLTFQGTVSFDSLSTNGHYDISGKVLALSIRGSGNYTSTLGPSTGSLLVIAKLVERDGDEYCEPTSIKATIAISEITSTFYDLFNGNEELSRIMNQVLNENSKEILKEVAPAIENVAERMIWDIMIGITNNIPYRKLLPPS